MENKKMILDRLNQLYENPSLWRDPYDTEDYHNRYIRKLMKVALYYIPNILYKTKLVKPHIWAENYELLGKCYLKLGEISKAEKIYTDLIKISGGKLYWGLPIDWKSRGYIFPKGIMMSTTTAEVALFFIELNNVSRIVENEVLNKIGENLLFELNRVFEDENRLILGYTKYDDYKVNNSNLLVAAALYEIGKCINREDFINAAKKITNACIEGISSNGGVPYFMGGDRYDSYHQVFSLRALNIIKDESDVYSEVYDKALDFLKTSLMDSKGNVYLSTKKDKIDMQGSTEALNFFYLLKDKEYIKIISRQIDEMLKNNKVKYVQRVLIKKNDTVIRSKVIFTRQGELRLLLCKAASLGDINE